MSVAFEQQLATTRPLEKAHSVSGQDWSFAVSRKLPATIAWSQFNPAIPCEQFFLRLAAKKSHREYVRFVVSDEKDLEAAMDLIQLSHQAFSLEKFRMPDPSQGGQ